MVGIPGSGKSFFAEKFADTFQIPYIEAALYRHFAADSEAAAGLVTHAIKEFAKTKQSLVLEIDTDARNKRTDLAKQLKSLGYKTLFVWVQTDETTAAQRSKKMYNMSKDDHSSRVRQFSPPHETENALVVSGKHTHATQVRMVLTRLTGPRIEMMAKKPVPERTSNIVLR